MANKIKILVVDDSDIILKLQKEIFKSFNAEVITSVNGLEGIKKAIEVKPDIILLDLLMPNFDGIKMLQVVKLLDQLKHIPVIVISGNTDKTHVLSAIEAGAEQVLAKPLNKKALISAVENALGITLSFGFNSESSLLRAADDELIEHLTKVFLEGFNRERDFLEKLLLQKNSEQLKHFAHNAKTVGQSIGYPQLSKINSEIENLLSNGSVSWDIIRIKFNQVFAIVKDIENSLVV